MPIGDDIRTIFREFNTDGDATSGPWNPQKKDLRDGLGAVGDNLAAAETLAQEWAENPEDSEVVSGQFSALHHAAKSSASATASAASASASAASASASSASATASASSASASATARTQAELAALAAGAPLALTIAAGRALVADTEPFLVQTEPGVQVYRRDSVSTETFIGWLGRAMFDTFADLNASTATYPEDTLIQVIEGGYTYKAAASGATDHHLTTAGGSQKLYVLPNDQGFNLKAFGAVGDGVADDSTAIQAALDAGNVELLIPVGNFDLGGGTLNVGVGRSITFGGGKLSNGTIACDDCLFFGARGLDKTITLTGSVANKDGIFFEWFDCEKASLSDYNTFINGTNATYGAAPTIANTNRTILQMLTDNRFRVVFGGGIYPFDDPVEITYRSFHFVGQSSEETLLWAPTSHFLFADSFGAAYCSFDRISIEADGAVLYTEKNNINAFHGLEARECNFISYSNHCFFNDPVPSGGGAGSLYGSVFVRCNVFAAADKAMFYEWVSASNVYDNVVEAYLFFNRVGTNSKGIPKAMFWNSNFLEYSNSNITYSGMDYLAYFDRAGLWRCNARNNIFEADPSGINSFEAIVKAETGTSNVHIDFSGNLYIGDTAKENGYSFILLAANVFVKNFDGLQPIMSDGVRNVSDGYVQSVTRPIDSGGTKYRLVYSEPHSRDNAGNDGPSILKAATQELADVVGMGDIYTADSANISSVQITRSLRAINGTSVVAGAGTTAQRPTTQIYEGFQWYDRTLGKPIWYDGTNWADADGTVV